jgi:hypothetical protein
LPGDPRPVQPTETSVSNGGLGPVPEGAPVINEFLAYNLGGLQDADGEPTDWIELYGPGDEDLPLAGFALSSAFGDVDLSPLDPSLVLPAHGHLLLYANAKPEDDPTNLTFTLPIAGMVALYWGYIGVDLLEYDPQSADDSAARSPDGSATWEIDPTPTPGAPNDP